jgi:hypothetical protein
MHQNNSKENKLKNNLKTILDKEDLKLHQELITHLSVELGVSILDCAAALSFLTQQNKSLHTVKKATGLSTATPKAKFVRYRLDIGQKHLVSLDEIKNILVEVSGVDKMRIGRLDIRNHYTLVDLPNGMPSDIFQLLSETELHQQKLNIKRIKFQNRSHRKNSKRHHS